MSRSFFLGAGRKSTLVPPSSESSSLESSPWASWFLEKSSKTEKFVDETGESDTLATTAA